MPDDTTHGTAIEWTHVPGYRGETWNPIVGCSPASDGCRYCYAAELAATRLKHNPEYAGLADMRSDGGGRQRAVYNGTVRWVPGRLGAPLRWRAPRAIFVGDMTDVYHPAVDDTWLDAMHAVMALTPWHLYLLLTKRPERMERYMRAWGRFWAGECSEAEAEIMRDRWDAARQPLYRAAMFAGRAQEAERIGVGLASLRHWPLPNVWLGTSAENQATAEARVPHLMSTPAALCFVSYEPALGPVELRRLQVRYPTGEPLEGVVLDALTGEARDETSWLASYGRIGWVVAGGESGHRARPWHPDWFRWVRDDCAATGVPYLHKQNGAWWPQTGDMVPRGAKRHEWPDGQSMWRIGKKRTGRLLDGRLHNAFPEVRRHA